MKWLKIEITADNFFCQVNYTQKSSSKQLFFQFPMYSKGFAKKTAYFCKFLFKVIVLQIAWNFFFISGY